MNEIISIIFYLIILVSVLSMISWMFFSKKGLAENSDKLFGSLTAVHKPSEESVDQKEGHLREIFKLFDKDGLEGFGVHQLHEVMNSFGMNPNHYEVKELISEIDPTGSEWVTFDMFVEAFHRTIKESDAEEEMREAFKVFDEDGNGLISINELKIALTEWGEGLTKEEFEEFVVELELDNNQEIDIEEFITILMSAHKSK